MKRKGFTLIELMISLTILVVLTTAMYYALGTELKFWQEIVNRAETQQIVTSVMSRLARDIRRAEEILPGSDNFDLILKIGPDTVTYSLTNDKVRRKNNSAAAYLTDEGDVSELFFAYPAPGLVEIYLGDAVTRVALRN